MKSPLNILILSIFLPIFGRIVLPSSEDNWLLRVSIAILVGYIFKNGRKLKFKILSHSTKMLLYFSGYCSLVLFVKIIISKYIPGITTLIEGYLFGLLIAIVLEVSGALNNYKLFIKELSKVILLLFAVQIVVSLIDSFFGINVFGFSGREIQQSSYLTDRDPFQIFDFMRITLSSFSTTFTGLFNSHNTFGVMLVYYNSFFILAFGSTNKKKYLLILMSLVFVAALLNTTRTTIIAIFISDIIYFIYRYRMRRLKQVLFLLILPFLILFPTIDIISQYFDTIGNLAFRLAIWSSSIDSIIKSTHITYFFFGFPLSDITAMSYNTWKQDLGSFENEFIRIYLYFGLLGLISFINFFIFTIFRLSKSVDESERSFPIILGLSILITSLSLDVFSFYAVQFLFVPQYLYLNINNRNYHGYIIGNK